MYQHNSEATPSHAPNAQPFDVGHAFESPGINWRRYYYLFLKWWWFVVIIAFAVTLGAFGWVSRQPKIYQSKVVLQVEQKEQKVLQVDEVQPSKLDSMEFMNTVVHTLTNRSLMLRVVDALKLDQDPVYSRTADGQTLSREALAGRLKYSVDASIRRGTRLIDVSVSNENPELAQKLAAAIAREFMLQSFDLKLSVSTVANEYLSERATELKEKLEASERRLQAYREKHKAVSLESSQNIIVDKLKELNSQVTVAKANRLRLESDLQQIRKIPEGDIESLLQIGSVASIPQVAGIRDQLVKAEAELAGLQNRYLEKHPKHIAATAELNQYRTSLKEVLRTVSTLLEKQYAAAEETEAKLLNALQEQEKAALDLNNIAIPYNVLLREVESDRAMYDAVINRVRETSLSIGAESMPYRVVEEPMVASVPTSPDVKKTVLLAALVGLAAGAGLVLLFDMINSSIRSVDEAEEQFGLPVISAVPDERFSDPLVLQSSSDSQQAEAFRTLRTSLSLTGVEESRKVFLFSSAVASEGKTFTTANAAIAFAQQGLKTIAIDADLRRPKLGKVLLPGKDGNEKGLTNYLSESEPVENYICPTGIEGLDLLPAGQRAPNPAELLAQKGISGLIAELLLKYDRVIIDTAPVNAVSDTLLLARHAHGVIMVVRANKTPEKAVQRALRLMESAGARLVGITLNRLAKGLGSQYYYYHYGDEYTKGVYGASVK